MLSLAFTKKSLPPYANAEAEDNLAVTFQLSSMVTCTCTASSSLTCTYTAVATAASWECNPETDSEPASLQASWLCIEFLFGGKKSAFQVSNG